MSDAGTATGKVVVHRTMSLDGFIAGTGDSTRSGSVTTLRFRVRK